jgi:hypothetical protein
MTTKKRLTRVAPLQAGIVFGVLYGIFGLIAAPFLLVGAFTGREANASGILIAAVFPVLYAIGGLIGGLLAAALYNLVAKWTGGLELELREDSSAG